MSDEVELVGPDYEYMRRVCCIEGDVSTEREMLLQYLYNNHRDLIEEAWKHVIREHPEDPRG